jgi:hypothetical protein
MGSNPVGRTIFFQRLPCPGRFVAGFGQQSYCADPAVNPINPTRIHEESVE